MPANRYRDLLASLPKPTGSTTYASLNGGEVLPYLDAPHQFQLGPVGANETFHVHFNDVAGADVTADVNGIAIVYSIPRLQPGDYDIKLVSTTSGTERHFYASVKNIATWFAMYADILNGLDADIDDMDAARSLATVGPKYIENVYGRSLRQPRPSLFRHEEYRNLLRQLRPAYRHFGAHPFGLSQAVEGFTSVEPLIVPDAWRPHWILGHQIATNGDLQERSRLSNALLGPAGAVSTSPVPEFEDLNRQSRYWIHPGVGTVLVSSGFRDPPRPQHVTVTTVAANQFVDLTGLDETGVLVAETVPDPSTSPTGGTYVSQKLFSRVLTAQRTGPGVQTAQVGLGDDRFIRLANIGGYNRPGTMPDLTYTGLAADHNPRLSWGAGDTVELAVITPLQGYGLSLVVEPKGIVALGNANESFVGAVSPGQAVTITRATHAKNNGTFLVTKVDATTLRLKNAAAVDETSSFHWLVNTTLAPFVGSKTLRDVNRHAIAIGRRETAGSYNLDPTGLANPREYFDRLHLELDDRGVVTVYISAASASPATIATDINTAFNADARYGASYNAIASAIAGTEGDNLNVLRIRAPNGLSPTLGLRSRIKVHPGPADGSVLILGLPRSSSYLLSAVGGYSLNCADTSRMPDVSIADVAPFRRRFQVRIRGLRFLEAAGFLVANGSFDSTEMLVGLTGYTFTAADIGGYVFWNDTDFGAPNNGMHRIIGLVSGSALLRHQDAATGGLFHVSHGTGLSAGAGVVWGKGEIHTVTNNNVGTHTLTLDTSEPTPAAWQIGSIVELVEEAPYVASGAEGIGTVDVSADVRYRPYHDFGDSISFVAGTTWRLTSARGLFTGQVGQQLVIEGCQNLENNSPPAGFTVTAVTATTVDFLNASAIVETSSFEWRIDVPAAPVVDTAPISGSMMPDGWQVTSVSTTVTPTNSDPTVTDISPALLTPSRVVLHQSTTGIISLRKTFDNALEWRGLPLQATFWLQEHTANTSTFAVDVSFDGSTFFSVATTTAVPQSVLRSIDGGTQFTGPLDPFEVGGIFFVPYDATTVVIRLSRTPLASAAGTISLEHMVLRSLSGTGLACGDNTVPRSQKRAKFGKLLYVWSAENLSDEEKQAVGLPLDGSSVPAKPGHIDYITNAHGYWDRVDVSEVDETGISPVRNNIRGVFDSIDWVDLETFGNLVGLQAVIGTPSRLSYARPTKVTHITSEPLVMIDGGDGPGYARATLSQTSNHDGTFPQAPNTGRGTGARLSEVRTTATTLVNPDGLTTVIPVGALIPLPDTLDVDGVQPWEFMTSTQIRIRPPYFNPLSSYVLDYDLLMRATTRPFELASGANTIADYVWLIDFSKYVRHNVEESFRTRVEQAQFKADYSTTLKERADTTLPATLERDDGNSIQTILFSDWEFLDSKTIRINSAVFDQNSLYTFTYTAKVPNVKSNVKFSLEWRAAADSTAILSAPWVAVASNQVIGPHFTAGPVSSNTQQPWHQIRVTVSGVEDVRDTRIYGLGIKGVHLYGASAYAPGILTPGP